MNPQAVRSTRRPVPDLCPEPRMRAPTRWLPALPVIPCRPVLSALILAIVLSPFALAHAGPVQALPARQAPAPFSYTLVDRWTEAPWRLRPGHLREASDITVADDGVTFVLDRRARAVHAMAPDGTWPSAFPLPPLGEHVLSAIDAAPDGSLYVLSRQHAVGWQGMVTHLDRAGNVLDAFEPVGPVAIRYGDLAVGPDGRIFLGRVPIVEYLDCDDPCSPHCRPTVEDAGVDVFDPSGGYTGTFGSDDLWLVPALDVDPDGIVYVVNAAPGPRACGAMRTPFPTPTPRPSARRLGRPVDRRSPAGTAADVPAVDRHPSGVAVFGPNHRLRSAFFLDGVDPDNAAAVGASAGGAFVGHGWSVRRITATGLVPAYRPVSQVHRALGVLRDGSVATAIDHCPVPAIGIHVWRPDGRPSMETGVPDDPRLEGPVLPIRVAAAGQLAVLQDLYLEAGATRPALQVPATVFRSSNGLQSIQRWPRRADAASPADPASQLGACLTAANNQMEYPAVDIAADGDAVYTLAPTLLERRPNDQLPDWSRRYLQGSTARPRPHMTHVAAHRGRLAVLDVGTAQVRMYDPAAGSETAWAYGGATANAVPSDIALWAAGPPEAHRVYLADRGRNRVAVHTTAGTRLTEWTTHDGPVGLAIGPTGDVFVLGRGGWGLRYTPGGTLVAYWRMPDPTVEARDLAVDDDGIAYVAYALLGDAHPALSSSRTVREGGIWLFRPAPGSPDTYYLPPDPDRCSASVDKTAAPGRLPLGNRVAVTLRVGGACPGRPTAAQVALVLDTSFSMSHNHALARAQDAVNDMLAEMDPDLTDVALVTFGDGAALQAELTRDLPSIASTVLRLAADGDTRMAAGIDVALTELTGARARRDVRRVMLLVTDGVPKDQPLEVAQAVRAAGIELFALVFPSAPLTGAQRDYLVAMVGAEDRFVLDPGPDARVAFARALTRYVLEPGLFDRLTVTDVVPGNMRYVPGSAVPPAVVQGDTLTWTLGRVAAADPPVLRFEVVPQAVGTWPTNVEAVAEYVDITGAPGRLVFPVPEVEVYAPPPIYLPVLANGACNPVTVPIDVVLALDTSESMREPDVHGGSKIEAVRTLAVRFAELVGGGVHRVGVVGFSSGAAPVAELTGDRAALARAVAGLTTAPGTRIDLGLAAAGDMLARGARPGARRVVVLLTDGRQGGGDDSVLRAAGVLHAAGATVYAIGLGADVDAYLLRQVASSPQGYHASPTTDELTAITRAITAALTCRWP